MNWGLEKSVVSVLNFLVLMKENVLVLRKYTLKYFEVKGNDVLQLNSQMVQNHNMHVCVCLYVYAFGDGVGRRGDQNK